MTPPCPAPSTLRMEAHAFTVSDRSGPRLVVAREGDCWTVYRVTVTIFDDGATGRHLTIARDGVTAARLPAVLLSLLAAIPAECGLAPGAQDGG